MIERSLGRVEIRFSGVEEGDAREGLPGVPTPWTRLRQVHGARVVTVDAPGACAGEEADAAVTTVPGAALAVLTADCAPVALASEDGVVGVAHAGWRGLVAGVIPATVSTMRDAGARGAIRAVVGPCIEAACYEFGVDDLDAVAAVLGDVVRGETAEGRPALDVAAAVRSSLTSAGVEDVDDVGVCTACAGTHFSHRARGDLARQALVAWISTLGGS